MRKATSIRVLHCPALVGGHPFELVRNERELGLQSWSVALYPGSYGYPIDETISIRDFGFWKFELRRWGLLVRALCNFDLIHFNFGRSILPPWIPEDSHPEFSPLIRKLYQIYSKLFELKDLPLLKLAGKKIVVTYQGNDARQGDFCASHFAVSPAAEAKNYYTPEMDARRRWRIKKFAQIADLIYACNPDLLHVLPSRAKFLPYCHLNINEWKPCRSSNGTPLVIHAPTDRNVKGTRFIIEAVERLKREHVRFDFVLIEGMTREKARRHYEKADLFVDQLLCGWYGGAAVELMALGKPVLCYIRPEDLKFIPQEMADELPIISATPNTIYDALKKCLTTDADRLGERGRQSRAFVEQWHNPSKIAADVKLEYEAILIPKRDVQ